MNVNMDKTKSHHTSDVYRVEELLSRRQKGRRVEYLVKWKNWPERYNTWEPERNILDKRLIATFARNTKRAEQRSKIQETSDKSPPELLPIASCSSSRDSTPPGSPTPGIHPTIVPSSLTDSPHNAIEQLLPTPHLDHAVIADNAPTETVSSPTDVHNSPSSIADKWEVGWVPERRFRPSTLIVAAASASAAHTAAAMASSRSSTKHSSLTTTSAKVRTPPRMVSETSPTRILQTCSVSVVEDRPKIRLTIPRERLLPCPPPGVSSSTSSNSRNSSQLTASSSSLGLEDDVDHSSVAPCPLDAMTETASIFLAPTELPRRAMSVMSPPSSLGLRHSEIIIEPSCSTASSSPISPKWTSSRTCKDVSPVSPVPKFFLHPSQALSSASSSSTSSSPSSLASTPILVNEFKRRHSSPFYSSAESTYEMDDSLLFGRRKRKHPDHRGKRRRHHDHHQYPTWSESETYSVEQTSSLKEAASVKLRRQSGGYSSDQNHTSHLSSESPRLAPLRIQLPRPIAARLTTVSASIKPTSSQFRCGGPDSVSGSMKLKSRKASTFPVPQSVCCNQLKESTVNTLAQSQSLFSFYQPSRGLILSPNAKQFRLVQDISVTDVTVGGLTISIKESSGPDNFFGVPSNQLVHWGPTVIKTANLLDNVPIRSTSGEIDKDLTIENSATRISSPRPISRCSDSSGVDENVAPVNAELSLPRVSGVHCILKSPSTLIKDVRDLSTIYEESTIISSRSNNCSPITLLKSEATAESTSSNLFIPNPLPEIDKPVFLKTEVPDSVSMLIQKKAILTSTETPSSPGFIVSPRRSSTPIERSPTRSLTPLTSVCSRPESVPTPTSSIHRSLSTALSGPFISSTTLTSSALFGKPIVNNSPISKPRNSKSIKKPGTSGRKSTSKVKPSPSTTRPSGPIRCLTKSTQGSASIPSDAASVYQFSDATSPTQSAVRPAVARRRRHLDYLGQAPSTSVSCLFGIPESQLTRPSIGSSISMLPATPIDLLAAQFRLNAPPVRIGPDPTELLSPAAVAAAYFQQQLQTLSFDPNIPFSSTLDSIQPDRGTLSRGPSFSQFTVPTSLPVSTLSESDWSALILNHQTHLHPHGPIQSQIEQSRNLTSNPTTNLLNTGFGTPISAFPSSEWLATAFGNGPVPEAPHSSFPTDDSPIDLSTKR